jgi:branched-chain amino acid transport system substrate-binding protein
MTAYRRKASVSPLRAGDAHHDESGRLRTAGCLVQMPFAVLVTLALSASALAQGGPVRGDVKIGNTMPYSGAASAYATIGRAEAAYIKMINDRGGINGRKIDFLSLDDGYSPPKTVEQTRKLVENDEVLFMFSAFGTATVSAVQKYLADRKVPQLFFITGASKWEDRRKFPSMVGWQPTYRSEAMIYAKYLLRAKPDAKIAVLYQNDDYGRDYLQGLRDGLAEKADAMIVKEATYQVSDATIDSQIITLQGSGADVLFDVTTAKFAAQAIRKSDEIGWKPLHLLNSISSAVATVLEPAGLDKSTGIVSAAYSKDPSDPQFKDDQGVGDYLAFMRRYYPDGDPLNMNNVISYSRTMSLEDVLRRCGDDLSRENVLRQADSLDLELPMLLPGLRVRSGRDRPSAITEMQLLRFNGKSWERFGELVGLQN